MIRFICICSTLLLLIACNQEDENLNYIEFDITYHKEMNRKFLANEPQKYSYIYSHRGFSWGQYKIFLSDQKIDSVKVYRDVNNPIVDTTLYSHNIPNEYFDRFSIPKIYAQITTVYNSDNGINIDTVDAYISHIVCSYDSIYHHPIHWDFSHETNGKIKIDAYSDFRIDSFTIVNEKQIP